MRSTVTASFVALFLLLFTPLASTARQSCDADGSDAAALASAREEIDAACPCDAASSRSRYRQCAQATLRGLVANATLPAVCRRQARRYATVSVCGRPGSVVCCRVSADGRQRHRVVYDASACIDTPDRSACVSPWQSAVTGCDANGCVAPVCGNGVVESGEQCDPPSVLSCDSTCQAIACDTVPAACGNGVVDAGETCEPPGVGSCGRDCNDGACSAAEAGEIEVACIDGTATIDSAATAGGYLLAWNGPHRYSAEVLARRFDADGAAIDSVVTIANDELPCTTQSGAPSVASDGGDYYVAWPAYGEPSDMPGAIFQAIYARRIGASGGAAPTDELAFTIPIGTCRESIGGPTAAAGGETSHFAAAWQVVGTCFTSILYRNPAGALLDFTAAPVQTPAPIGIPIDALPYLASTGPAAVATLGSSTLWVWHAVYAPSSTPPYQPFIAAAWSDGASTSAPFWLSARQLYTGSGRPRPAAGASAILTVWGQGADDSATSATQVRALRVTRADGRIDPDGGLLLATVATQVSGGPVAAFDGTRWLVVWAQAAADGNELRAVAVEQDGTVVDTEPRLIASAVAAAEPGVASTGDGRVLVAFARPDGTSSALRAKLVVP